jgi:hypothetical protein
MAYRHPYTHSDIPNSTGLYSVLSNGLTTYICTLCHTENFQSSRALRRHCTSLSHKNLVQATATMNMPSLLNQHIASPLTEHYPFVMNPPCTHTDPTTIDEPRSDYMHIDESIVDANIDNMPIDIDYDGTQSLHIIEAISTLKELFNENSPSYRFYANEMLNHAGKAAIISHSILKNDSFIGSIHEEDIDLQFCILELIISSSNTLREKLVNVFQRIMLKYNSSLSAPLDVNRSLVERLDRLRPTPSFIPIDLPLSVNEIRSNYTLDKNSMWKCLPSADIRSCRINTKMTHAFASVKQSIAHVLASGGRLLTKHEMIGRELDTYNTLIKDDSGELDVVFLQLWSDSFEPNTTKTNRGSLWIATLTVMSSKATRGKIINTFPMGLCRGSDGETQDVIMSTIIQEINELSRNPTTFYYRDSPKVLKCFVRLHVVLQDQIERRKRYYILLGNSKPSSRWGYHASTIDTVINKIPACSDCLSSMRTNTWRYDSPHICPTCLNWDTTHCEGTVKLTHEYLLRVLEEANSLAMDGMNFSGIRAYTKARGLNEAAAILIDKHVEAVKKKLLITTDTTLTESTKADLVKDMIGPNYELWTGSPLWSSITHDVEDTVDVPLHLIFLGIVKSTMAYVANFLSDKKISKTFDVLMRRKLNTFILEYKLSWLVVINFKSNEVMSSVGWVGENFIAFSRLFKWYMSSIILFESEATTPAPIADMSSQPIQKWNKIHLVSYLESHGFVRVPKKTLKDVLRIMVEEHQRTGFIPPEFTATPTTAASCTVLDVFELTVSLHDLLKVVMGPSHENTRNEIERHSRLFLSQLHKVCATVGTEAVFLRKWNAQSLLNLGKMYSRFGPFSNLWEGGFCGEGFIKRFKKEISNYCLNSFPEKILDNVNKRKSLEIIMSNTPESAGGKKMHHVYTSSLDVRRRLVTHQSISAIHCSQTNEVYIAVKDAKAISFIRLLLTREREDMVGIWYSLLLESADGPGSYDPTLQHTFSYLVLLPSEHLISDNLHYYCICHQSWDEELTLSDH